MPWPLWGPRCPLGGAPGPRSPQIPFPCNSVQSCGYLPTAGPPETPQTASDASKEVRVPAGLTVVASDESLIFLLTIVSSQEALFGF